MGVVCVSGALQEKLEPMLSLSLSPSPPRDLHFSHSPFPKHTHAIYKNNVPRK